MTDHRVICGDSLHVLPTLDAESVDAIVCDPPYGLSFMGKEWDHGVPGAAFWREALRVAKPGAHLLAFGGTRTHHRLMCAIEDAGWEIRDCLSWIFGSGFPKSHNLDGDWKGWGTALKPAFEPIILARKPLVGTVAANVAQYGTGAMNVDGCRIATTDDLNGGAYAKSGTERNDGWGMQRGQAGEFVPPSGRWPANVCLDEDAAAMLDEQSGERSGKGGTTSGGTALGQASGWNAHNNRATPIERRNDTGGASRFFYTAKASRREREAGLDGMPEANPFDREGPSANFEKMGSKSSPRTNPHPTVKPLALMRWLCRLVTPPNGLVLDPFTGSGSTGCAAVLEGFRFVGIEREPEYAAIAEKRIAHWAGQVETPEPSLFNG